jgi:hypothetical protein
MSTPNTSDTGQPAKSSILQMKITNWLYAVVGLIVAGLGLLQIYNAFFPGLPSCTSDTAGRSIRDIFKQKNVQLTGLTDQKTITESSSEETCQANFVTPAEAGTLYYRIYWKDKSAQILITKVDTHPR